MLRVIMPPLLAAVVISVMVYITVVIYEKVHLYQLSFPTKDSRTESIYRQVILDDCDEE